MVFWASATKDDLCQVTDTGNRTFIFCGDTPRTLAISNTVKSTYTMNYNWSLEMTANVLGEACKWISVELPV